MDIGALFVKVCQSLNLLHKLLRGIKNCDFYLKSYGGLSLQSILVSCSKTYAGVGFLIFLLVCLLHLFENSKFLPCFD